LKHFPVYTSLEEGGFISICNEYVGKMDILTESRIEPKRFESL